MRRGVRRVARETGRSKEVVVKRAARGFVRMLVAITPPGSAGTSGTAAKEQGAAAIASDVGRIFEVISDRDRQAFRDFYAGDSVKEGFGHTGAAAIGEIERRILTRGQMAAWHAKRRNKSNGRVMAVRGGDTNNFNAHHLTTGLRKKDLRGIDIGYVSRDDYEWFVRVLQKGVGFLAAGWNAAAIVLGVRVPAWIARHGASRGAIRILTTDNRYRIEIVNDVPFVDGVRDLDRRVAKAVEYHVAGMNREADFLQKKQHSRPL